MWQKCENKGVSVPKTFVIMKSLCTMDDLVSCTIRYHRRRYCCHESSSSFHRSRNKTTRSNWWLMEDNEMLHDALYDFPIRSSTNNLNNAVIFRSIPRFTSRICFRFFVFEGTNKIGKFFAMNQYPGRIQSVLEDYRTSTMIDHGFPNRTIKTSCPSDTTHQESIILKQNEILRICQALLLSTCMLLLSYHSIRYGRTEYSILANGKITQGYAHKAVVTLSLGYSIPYSVISFLAIGMLAYSIVSKSPRWSIPSIILYLIDLVYDVSGAFIVIWLLFSNLPTSMAFSYATGTILLILGEVWIWLGVLRLYEQRTFK